MKLLHGICSILLLSPLALASDESSSNESTEPATATKSDNKLRVSVYYETMCPDSKRFITTQLHPVKRSPLGKHFEVDLVPYGKATTTASGDSYTFECQHGSAECKGNKMHACALKYINSTEAQLDFVHCSMSKKRPPTALPSCASELELDPEPIKECAEGPEGSRLLAGHGEETHGLKPKLYFVPWITYSGKWTEDNLLESQDNFKSVLCRELRETGNDPCNGGVILNAIWPWTLLLSLLTVTIYS